MMNTSDKVRAVLACSGKRMIDLAEYLGMKKQNLNTKMQRDSWPAADLARVAQFVGGRVGFFLPDGTTIYLDPPEEGAKKEDPDAE